MSNNSTSLSNYAMIPPSVLQVPSPDTKKAESFWKRMKKRSIKSMMWKKREELSCEEVANNAANKKRMKVMADVEKKGEIKSMVAMMTDDLEMLDELDTAMMIDSQEGIDRFDILHEMDEDDEK
jgi:hypothetical protein